MQAGDLVRITRTSIGVPTGAVGLILEPLECDLHSLYRVYLMNKTKNGTKTHVRRYLGRDLEVIK